jgi:hypothetical protein
MAEQLSLFQSGWPRNSDSFDQDHVPATARLLNSNFDDPGGMAAKSLVEIDELGD